MSSTTIIRPRALIRRRQKRSARERLTVFTKTKVVALLGLTVCAIAFTTWHAHKQPSSTTMSAVTVEGNATTPAIPASEPAAVMIEPTPAAAAASASCVPCPAASLPTPAVR